MMTDDAKLFRKLRLRVMPILVLCFVAAYVDRANLGFAAIAMNAKYGFSATVYGWAAGIFFLGYTLVEIPSNLILAKVGARRWIARIMITWGVISSLTAFVWSAESLYVARFLLGVAEAGFVPGVMVYLSRWFPDGERARTVGWFQCGGPISSVIAAPISGLFMAGHGAFGLENWQLLFVMEGLPSIVMGVIVLLFLAETPDDAKWLDGAERGRLKRRIAEDHAERDLHGVASFKAALGSPRLLLLGLAWLLTLCGSYAVLLWLPLIVKSFGVSNGQAGWLVAIPYVLSTAAILIWTRLCVPNIRFCNIDGEGRQGQVVRRRRRGAQSHDGEGRPCSEIDASSTHYNRRHIRVGSGAGAFRQTRSCGRDIRGGSSR
jgi:MFS transporter, ACS family, tartrate transporter